MAHAKNRLLASAFALAATVALSGCEPSSDDSPPFPPPPPETGVANFSTTAAGLPFAFPYPIDPIYFSGTLDLTLNAVPGAPAAPWRSAAIATQLNTLDGWSTSATIDTSFSLPIDPASISGTTVKMVKLWLNPKTKGPANPAVPAEQVYLPAGATSAVAGVLTYGTDFKADVSPDVDSGGKVLRITPLKPLDFSRGPAVNTSGPNAGKLFNVGYLVILTNGLKATNGNAMAADKLYADIKSAPADCSTLTISTHNILCQFTKPQLVIAQATGTDPASIILSWSFSTQSVDDTLNVISLGATAQQTLVVPTGQTTKQASAALAGKADIYVGSTKLPYYLTPPANPNDRVSVTQKYWTAAGPPNPAFGLDPTSRNLTMFNPVPAKVADVTVPLLVTVPNATSACPGKPTAGWPVVIFAHGIGRNRTDALGIADAYADACFVVAAIDLPLHGIVDTTSPFYCTPTKPQCIGATERTFDIDIQNNTTGAAVPDGKIDPSAGFGTFTYLNLANPITGRDNLRQSGADFIVFTKSVATMAIAPGTPAPAGPLGMDPARIHFIGQSMGGIVGGLHVHFANDTQTAIFNVPGGPLTLYGLDSASYGPALRAFAASSGVVVDSYIFNLLWRDVQAIIDAGDPINHVKDAAALEAVLVQKVLNDQVAPNSATDRLITAGGLRKLKTIGPNAVSAGSGAYTFFSKGDHGTLLDPTASLAAWVEMQKQAVLFAASANQPGGPFVTITDPTVLDLN